MGSSLRKKSVGGKSENKFWQWFVDNQKFIQNFENDQDNVISKIISKIKKVHSDLTFELSSLKDNGKRDFIISAGGIISAFPFVESLFKAAPELEEWEIIKFHPRRSIDYNIKLGDKDISAKDVCFHLYPDEKLKVGIIIFLPGFSESEFEIFGNIGFLILDLILGEYDVETKIGHIDFDSTESENFDQAKPVLSLAAEFDEYYSSIIN